MCVVCAVCCVLWVLCAACCCICGGTPKKKRTTMDNITGQKTCCKQRGQRKNARNIGEKYQNTDCVFGTITPSTDPKKVRKRPFSQRFVFLTFFWDLSTFSAESPVPKRPKTPFLDPRHCSKGPYHALERSKPDKHPAFFSVPLSLSLFDFFFSHFELPTC